MKLEELDQLDAQRKAKQDTIGRGHWRRPLPNPDPFEIPDINWKLVVGIVFGFFVWYVGAALLQQSIVTAPPTCCPTMPSHFEP